MKRIVIKVGSHVLTEGDHVARERMRTLVDLVAEVKQSGIEVILVSSGAVAAGYTQVPLDRNDVASRQALAAIGQPFLLKMYQEKFARHEIVTAQVLLSADVFDSRKATRHAKAAVDKLLSVGTVPIINENDTVSIDELVFGDNDRLSAHVAHYFDADPLVLLSDIDAYYDKDPRRHSDAQPRNVVTHIPPEALIDDASPNGAFATGGIVTKLQAADFLMGHHREMFLASGFDLTSVRAYIIEGKQTGGTVFAVE